MNCVNRLTSYLVSNLLGLTQEEIVREILRLSTPEGEVLCVDRRARDVCCHNPIVCRAASFRLMVLLKDAIETLLLQQDLEDESQGVIFLIGPNYKETNPVYIALYSLNYSEEFISAFHRDFLRVIQTPPLKELV